MKIYSPRALKIRLRSLSLIPGGCCDPLKYFEQEGLRVVVIP